MDVSHSPPQEVTRTSFAAMGGVLFSRASGVVRTIIVNSTFGAATALDAFNAAFRLPNSMRDLLADGALSAAFMTALVSEKQKGHDEERQLIAIVLGFFSVVTLFIACVGMVCSHPIIRLITEANFKLSGGLPIAVSLFQMLVFYLPLTMTNAVIMAILGVHGQSFRAMNGSLFLSVGMICGALIFAPLFHTLGGVEIYGLGVGALLGAVLQMCYQMRPLFALQLIPWPNLDPRAWWRYLPLRKILMQMAPRALGQSAMVVALSINTYFATQIGAGVLTYIVTAIMIIQVPIGLFGVATGFVALPALMSALAQKNVADFSRLLIEGLRTSFWLATFATICFALLIFPLYVVLFQHGKIGFQDSISNCIAICVYSTGIILAAGNKILVNTLYALDATRQILYNAIIYLVLNTLLNIWLVPQFGLLGIGFSFGVATSVDFWLNYFASRRYFRQKDLRGSPYQLGGKFFAVKVAALNLFSFMSCLLGIWLINHVWQYSVFTFWQMLLILTLGGSLLVAMFVFTLFKLGPDHLKNMLIRERAKKTGILSKLREDGTEP